MGELNQLKAFQLRRATWDADWQKIKNDCPTLSEWGINNLKAGLKDSARSVILEPHYICKDHRNLFSNFYSKKFTKISPDTSRLHFFSKSKIDITEILLYPDRYVSKYLGFSVIRPIQERCLGRSVFDPYLLNQNDPNYYCLRTQFRSHIGGTNFSVSGYPYISQDADVTVCAHSALWGVCRYLSEKYSVYAEMYPFDLVNLTESSSGRAFPYRGMTYSDYCSILAAFGSYPIIVQMKKNKRSSRYYQGAFENLYSYVESGFPVLASFQGHVVTLVGHTIDYNKPTKPNVREFIDSSFFVNQFIVIDDNFFPYRLLGRKQDPCNYGKQYADQYNINSIVTAVCPLPEKVFLPAEKARKVALEYYKAYKTKLKTTGTGPFVTRLFLTTGTAWKRRLLERSIHGIPDWLSFFVSKINLPHFIWVMEAGPLDLYKKGICTAELVLDSTGSEMEDLAIYMRIGNMLIFSGLQNTFGNCPIQFKQFTHNLGER
jgi:hypothetical protein